MTPEGKSDLPTIACSGNGPYIVKGLERLRNSKGETLPTRATIALCRCGHSSKKPFCDGTHAQVGFSSVRESDKDIHRRKDYVGKRVTIHDNRTICSHAGFCTARLKTVFRMDAKPWIDPDGADVEAIIETVRQCPSGALSYSIDGVEHRDQDRESMITISKNGPYYVTGGIAMEDASGLQPPSQEHYALCRCGASKNKPFCDGSHWQVKFHDEKN
jgi:CDGSH-type Zn-finger protein